MAKAPAKKAPAPKQKTRSAPSRDALDEIGLEALCDMILEGKSYRDICQETGVSLGGLTRWFAKEPERLRACEAARVLAAQAFDEQALEGVQTAADFFSLSKAKEAAVHLRWRAKAANPKRYGDRSHVDVDLKATLYDSEQAKKMAAFLTDDAGSD